MRQQQGSWCIPGLYDKHGIAQFALPDHYAVREFRIGGGEIAVLVSVDFFSVQVVRQLFDLGLAQVRKHWNLFEHLHCRLSSVGTDEIAQLAW